MRVAALALTLLLLLPQPRIDPFVPVGVWYGGDAVRPPAVAPPPAAGDLGVWRADLGAIRAVGFNTIATWTTWGAAEPGRGEYRFDGLEALLRLASEVGLRVIVHVLSDPGPAWLPSPCADDPRVRGDLDAFVNEVATRAARYEAFLAIDVSMPPLPAPCAAEARFKTWLAGRRATPVARAEFDALRLAAAVEANAAAAVARGRRPALAHTAGASVLGGPVPDDWLLARAVDQLGVTLVPHRLEAAPLPLSRMSAAFDGVRSAARQRGWQAARLQGGPEEGASRSSAPVGAADVRLWGWTAMAHGARGVLFGAWRSTLPPATPVVQGLKEMDGSVGERARAAGEFAGIIGRNPSLFGTLAPRESPVAVLYDPASYAAGPAAREATLGAYDALARLDVQADFLHAADVASLGSRYRVIVVPAGVRPAEPVRQLLQAFARGGPAVLEGLPEGEGLAARLDAAGVVRDVRVAGGDGEVLARVLESSGAYLIVAVHHGAAPRRVTLAFRPEMPEAIWVNLETGASVSFVQTRTGPVLTHTFGPRDALVLVRSKRLR